MMNNALDNAMEDFGDDEELNVIVAEVQDRVLTDRDIAAPPAVQGTPGGKDPLNEC